MAGISVEKILAYADLSGHVQSGRLSEQDFRRSLDASLVSLPPCRQVSADSREVSAGCLFVAVRGLRTDGHRYLASALAQGACAAVVETEDPELPIPQLVVADTASLYPLLCAAFYHTQREDVRYIGITGTNGKTTTAQMVAWLLNQNKVRTAYIGTNGVSHPALQLPHLAHTTPEPAALHRLIRSLLDAGTDCLVMEVSSHALVQKRADGIPFSIAAFTNLSHEHLDYHGDMEAYASAKAMLFERLPAGGTAILNGQEPASALMASAGPAAQLWYSLEDETADLFADAVTTDDTGTQHFTLHYAGESHAGCLPLPGRYNVENALAALGVCLAQGVGIESLLAALASFPGSPGRMQFIDLGQPYKVVIDFAHTEQALHGLLQSLRPMVKGRLVLLLSVRGDRERDKRSAMGKAAVEGADKVYVTLKDSGLESPQQILEDLTLELSPDQYTLVPIRQEAIRRAVAEAEAGDVIAVMGLVNPESLQAGRLSYYQDDSAYLKACISERLLREGPWSDVAKLANDC
ncbi:MAG: UDP-N-acetylmuramoyl-L-alanyl-D-glutamate--2,6-diaminopimelate ligase [Clostridia bacterium]|nr:UDP-N-acetylmuramoyl-L-alanyl-D-glutamate--2,6-diaminopimelate ligase [Clostridia bacterium]